MARVAMGRMGLLMAVIGLWGAAPAWADETAAEVLEKVRAATGYAALASRPEGMVLKGRTTVAGLDGGYEIVFDAAGRYCFRIDTRMGWTSGFDGTTAWSTDRAGLTRVLAMDDRADALLGVWLVTGQWLAPGGPLKAELADGAGEGQVRLGLSLDDGATTVTATISRATWLPESFEVSTGPTKQGMVLSGYADHDGLKLPGMAEWTLSGAAMTFVMEEAGPAPQYFRSPYQRAAAAPPGTVFDPAVPAALETRRAKTGHLLVRPRVNGEEAGWFIFDTGAGATVIDTAVAQRLGLESFGSLRMKGVGGTVDAKYWEGRSLALGPVSTQGPVMVGGDLSFLNPHMGVEIGGIIGYDLLGRVAAEIDMAGGGVSIHDPAVYALPRGEWAELTLSGRVPTARATFEGHEGMFTLDTGAGKDSVTMMAMVTKRLKLLEARETQPASMGGVGGMVPARAGELEWMELAGQRFAPVKATFATEPTGVFGSHYLAGNIGGGLLGRFTLVLDYQGGRMALLGAE